MSGSMFFLIDSLDTDITEKAITYRPVFPTNDGEMCFS